MSEKDTSAKPVELQYPLIRKVVSMKALQQHAEQIMSYCDALGEPLFIEENRTIKYVILSKEYYVKCCHEEICPFPSDEDVAAALARKEEKVN